jgi:tryptophan synthase alpha chain
MNRLERRFAELRHARRCALIPFVTGGDPDPAFTVPTLHALVEAGADVLEIGVPFSDPMADGPVIQRANERALEKRVGLRRVLELVREFRTRDGATPVVLMGYMNPLEIYGLARFATDAAAAGVDGTILVDDPPDEAEPVAQALGAAGLAQVFLAAPTTTATRIERIAALGRGFLYYVSFAGITGADRIALDSVRARVQELKRSVSLPVAVGFGIKEPAQAAAIAEFADGVVIGSALVERLATASTAIDAATLAAEFLAPIRAAIDRARAAAAA